MDKTFQHDYAKIVIDFAQKMPPGLNITTQEIDAYFRECVLYLLSYNEQMRSSPDPRIINQLYTEVPVSFSAEQLASKIDCSQSDKSAGVAVPDFFHRMLTADAASGTRSCCEFIRVQQKVFTLYAALEATISFEESRRLTYLSDHLTAICEQEGVAESITLEGGETHISQDAIKALNSLLEESACIVFKKQHISSSKYVKYRELEQATETDDIDVIMEAAKWVDQKITQVVDAQEPPKKPERKQEDAAPTFVNMKIEDLLHGGAPDWAKGLLKDKKGAAWDEGQEEDTKPTINSAFAKLNAMIGLDSVKKQVKSLSDMIQVNGWRKEEKLKNQPMSLHLIFSGNPGTGKTTVARIIAEIYAALGVLSKGQMVEVDRSKLVGPYLGQTEERTLEVIESALGGVLFIDEAYALAGKDGDEYGMAAINTILKAMEDHYDDLVVIVAGYDKPMKKFIESNPGLKSRFSIKIQFEDYDGDQLYEIFQTMVQSGDYRLDENATAMAKMHFYQMYKNRDQDFGNGREVRNCFDEIRRKQAERLIGLHGSVKPPKEELELLTAADIMAVSKEP